MTGRMTQTDETIAQWTRVESVAGMATRILLYGPPGTGKSYLARTAGNPSNVWPVILTPDTPAAELRGHWIPNGHGGFDWADGPAVAAMRAGGRLVLDEIHRAADDAYAFLLAVLDDPETCSIALATTGEIIRPAPGFQVYATSNDPPNMLPEALQDRFTLSVEMLGVHPAAVAALPADLKAMAVELGAHIDPERRIGLRVLKEYARLRTSGIPDEDAARLCFGVRYREVLDAVNLAGAATPDVEAIPERSIRHALRPLPESASEAERESETS